MSAETHDQEDHVSFCFITCEARARGEHVSPGEELVASAVLSAPAHDAHVRVDREHDGRRIPGTRGRLISAENKTTFIIKHEKLYT